MACESKGVNDRRLNQFNKIRLLNSMANQIGAHGVQCGNVKLLEHMDMNCGAIPDGEFEQVIDLEAPHQFLSLYMQIAENRFAFAVTELVNMDPGFKKVILDYCNQIGKDMKVEKVASAQEAMEILETFVLDGMPCDDTKEIKVNTPEKVQWVKLMDTHETAWNKAGGDLSFYYELQQSFVTGLLSKSKIKYEIKEGSDFTLSAN